MFGIFKNHTKCVSFNNQKCKIQPTLINLHLNKYSQEFYYYPFEVKLDKCVRSCNTLNDLSNRVCVPNKTEDLDIHVFNMITEKNESNILTKDILSKCKCRFDGKKYNSNQWWNKDKRQCECKKLHVCEKDYIWNPSTCTCENGKYLATVMDDSAITCDKVIDTKCKLNDQEIKTVSRNFNEKKITCKTQNVYISLAFLLITMT